MRRSTQWLALAGVVIAVAGCGTRSAAPQNAGKPGIASLSLTTVPIVRSVTVSPSKASFGRCSGGLTGWNTHSTSAKLGFPNGVCWVGLLSRRIFPITITNTGIASFIDVSGASADPGNSGTQWSLCNIGDDPVVACTGRTKNLPGIDQYLVQTFSAFGELATGVTTKFACDHEFDASGRCGAVEGASQTEGVELTGPRFSTDESTKWTVTITWTPVPTG